MTLWKQWVNLPKEERFVAGDIESLEHLGSFSYSVTLERPSDAAGECIARTKPTSLRRAWLPTSRSASVPQGETCRRSSAHRAHARNTDRALSATLATLAVTALPRCTPTTLPEREVLQAA
jgi:hypothetical protein